MFQPSLPLTGFAGWTFLERTIERQTEAFNNTPNSKRLTAYFRENIAAVQTPEQLVNDRQLLEVALNAYGLGEDINNKAFIEKILTDGTSEQSALANRLADKRYAQFAEAFQFDQGIPNTVLPDFADTMLARYSDLSFEVAVGDQQSDLRLALNTKRSLADIATGSGSDDAKWFKIMGDPPLRQVFETALNLPSSFSQLDLDKQLEVFQDKAKQRFGSAQVDQFKDPAKVENLIRQFLLQSEVQQLNQVTSPASIALALIGG
ncbi:DUF1217 domain-containing protein [Nereida sp. MMG025]|uniref:DUF1217 domain-containing protein n=1 Tax=Nereida sp. MMG025 TaxID=2909981 RepID=UPI001F341E72|nr:DUF1217 domain-containing protein [Nereida sp. MMG025]MCF6444687.1 DUF1217 domain-containing protein [Nereida sp. MMG025]